MALSTQKLRALAKVAVAMRFRDRAGRSLMSDSLAHASYGTVARSTYDEVIAEHYVTHSADGWVLTAKGEAVLLSAGIEIL